MKTQIVSSNRDVDLTTAKDERMKLMCDQFKSLKASGFDDAEVVILMGLSEAMFRRLTKPCGE